MTFQPELFDRYLNIIYVKRTEPSFNLLKKIVRAHLIKVPFENISKLLYKKQGLNDIPDLPTFLEGIEKYNFGGTCYTNNYYLYCLLEYLGFEIKLCGADMKNPDVHIISITKIENHEYIVDVGYAAPFFEPLPRYLNENFEINFNNEVYLIKPQDENGKTKVEQYYEGNLQHWYTAKPETRKIEEFSKVINDSFADDATFMNAIRVTKFTENGTLVLKNFYFTKNIKGKSSTIKINLPEIPSLIQENFGIPSIVVEEAISMIKEIRDIYD